MLKCTLMFWHVPNTILPLWPTSQFQFVEPIYWASSVALLTESFMIAYHVIALFKQFHWTRHSMSVDIYLSCMTFYCSYHSHFWSLFMCCLVTHELPIHRTVAVSNFSASLWLSILTWCLLSMARSPALSVLWYLIEPHFLLCNFASLQPVQMLTTPLWWLQFQWKRFEEAVSQLNGATRNSNPINFVELLLMVLKRSAVQSVCMLKNLVFA